METVSDGCPTGILIDIDLQSKVLSNMTKGKEKIQASFKNKEQIITADTKSSHPWTSNCFLDQSPPRPSPILQMNFFTPKSNWKTPSPKSMKIISHEASRIVDQLYSSPINCSEVMIYDEVFPAVKSLDDACLDEFHIKSKSLPPTDMTFSHEKVDQSNPDSLDLTKCNISAVSSCTSKDFVSDEKLSKIVLQSDIKPAVEQDSISENTVETTTPENASNQKSHAESHVSDKDKIKCVICAVNSGPVSPECVNVLSDKFLAHEHEVTIQKKMSLEHSEKNKENILLSNGARRAKYGPRFSKVEKSCSSIEDGPKETKIRKNQILRNESMVEKSSKKNITAKCSVSEKKKAKENQNLEDSFSKEPKAFLQKSNVMRSQSLLYKKDPLCKIGPLLETPVVASSVRRIHSFHAGSSRNAFPVERKFMPTTDSCSRVLKPKMSLNQVSNNGNGLSTTLQFGRSKPADSSAANPLRRKSLVFNSNYSLVASGIKVAAQNDQHSIIKKTAVTSSSRIGLVKKLNMPSSHPKFKNDSLPRKLFP
ncbi:hypothetical protein AVEN_143729-1 [Araneus ventricosus]|uniref:Uncharacterized protein n=1 Tax=Araneus ventricosus TaxID=182803 RepID=A0A4Y2AQI8_ARAVE|nr:hypothetical protein AVEN_143729-1 [Araneus ventricosus]